MERERECIVSSPVCSAAGANRIRLVRPKDMRARGTAFLEELNDKQARQVSPKSCFFAKFKIQSQGLRIGPFDLRSKVSILFGCLFHPRQYIKASSDNSYKTYSIRDPRSTELLPDPGRKFSGKFSKPGVITSKVTKACILGLFNTWLNQLSTGRADVAAEARPALSL